jgi:pectate lyase
MSRTDIIAAVRAFADRVLDVGRDRYRGTPLLADGVNAQTLEPVEWLADGQRWAICNPACQQNLYRTLVGLSALTGERRYHDTTATALGYFFDHYVDSIGLLHWGGHQFVDLRTGNIVGEQPLHEFKACYPFYEFLRQVNAPATERFIRAFWNAHVLHWSNLDMTRHGEYDQPIGALWDNQYVGGEVFFEGAGLTFLRAGSDLVYAAGMLHHFTGDPGALAWAKRLAHRYVEARDPTTGLGAYQYSQPIPTAGRGMAGTKSSGGDRARNQLGPEFGERALEGKVLAPMHSEFVYGQAAVAQMRLAEILGESGRDFLDWTRTGLLAFARHGYDAKTNTIWGMFTDGTPIAPKDVKRAGYYTPAIFARRAPDPVLLLSYALASRLTRDPILLETARAMARFHSTSDDPVVLLALLELARGGESREALDHAQSIARNILANRFRDGFFFPSAKHTNARFSAVEPLALLSLEATLRGDPGLVPAYNTGQAYIHGPYDGVGRTTDNDVIWSR